MNKKKQIPQYKVPFYTLQVIWAILILFLIWAPFQHGLFTGQQLIFMRPVYFSSVVSGLLMILILFRFRSELRIDGGRGAAAAAVLLLPFAYTLALVRAASFYMASDAILISLTLAHFFIIGLYLFRHSSARRAVTGTLIGSGALIVIFGLMNWLGAQKFAGKAVGWFSNAVLSNGTYQDAVLVNLEQRRLTSVFQYPNTYAAFLTALLMALLFSIPRSSVKIRFFQGALLVPISISLLLTASRGGLLALPLSFLLLLAMLKPLKQIWTLALLLPSALFTLLVFLPFRTLGIGLQQQFDGRDAAAAWSLLLAASFANGAAVMLIHRLKPEKLETRLPALLARKRANLWIPSILLLTFITAIGLLLGTGMRRMLPISLQTSLQALDIQQRSAAERLMFYRDSIGLFRDYPITGAGGGAWATLYPKYQSLPYETSQTHNYLLQSLNETGLVGLLSLIFLLGLVFFGFIRQLGQTVETQKEEKFIFAAIALPLLVHSMLDFDMSYLYIGILTFLSLGGMASSLEDGVFFKPPKVNIWSYVYKTSLLVGSLIAIIMGARFLAAANAAQQATAIMQSGGQLEYSSLRRSIDRTLNIRLYPDIAIQLAVLLQNSYEQNPEPALLEEASRLLIQIYDNEPFNRSVIQRLVNGYSLAGQKDRALEFAEAGVDKLQWNTTVYEQTVTLSYTLGEQALARKNRKEASYYFDKGIRAYQKMEALAKQWQAAPLDVRPAQTFVVTPGIILNVGKMMYLSGSPVQAAEVFKPQLAALDYTVASDREIACWYIAALRAAGSEDKLIYQTLLSADPSAEVLVEQITALKP
ncbi:O-antigen ligase family protein [Saccharibacillus sp. CPCC 101409]|uniref:O-antigen ligase family protein n=1 Tax=Saccharibacillus sp. CPCC 101409 TaxID=3058041 RepID=UPI0026740205|nr:O-antigen ligase family protein [Saccharibacillus sp. CPCC 101409]MDO3412013.1 O-antigen ligase family protein [Saccharibacillus sp. CPCC 101409]